MTIQELSKLLPGMSPKEIKMISQKSLNNFFYLRQLSKEEIFIPKENCLYIVIDGRGLATGFFEDYLEFNMEFIKGESLGFVDLQDEHISFILKGMPSTTLLEVPIKMIMDKANIEFLVDIYNRMTKAMVRNIFKLFRAHAAKIQLSNEQFFIDFLISKGNEYTFTSTPELSRLLHIELRTLQRIIRKFTKDKIIEKNNKTFKIIDIDSAREILKDL